MNPKKLSKDRQRLRPLRELVCRYLPGIRSALHPGRDVLRKASSTYPLPKTIAPIFKNERNKRIKLTGTAAVAVPRTNPSLPNAGITPDME
jgi:hypothetical protein